MTTDPEEPDGDDGEDQDLDLEKLFDSIPTEQLEGESDVEVSATEEAPIDTITDELEETVDDAVQESTGEGGQRGRFDDFLDRIGETTGDRKPTDSSAQRQDIQELMGRMEGRTSASPGEEAAPKTGSQSGDRGSAEGTANETETPPVEPDRSESQPSSGGEIDEALREGLASASDVLFRANRTSGSDGDVCHPFFSIHPPSEQNVLLISLRQSSEDRMDAFYAGATGTPDNLAVITSSDAVRSTTTATGGSEDSRSNITVKVVNDPGDLTRLGITISNVLSSWQGSENQTLVCFDSLSSLLQYADLQRVFRFIHVLQGRLGNVDATTHYHLDPEAHDSQTQATIRSLFDGVISETESGGLAFE